MTIDLRTASSQDFFEKKYKETADPWNFAGSAYELARYEAIMAALRARRYNRGFEPGCSVGVLTERLATICSFVEAIDFSATAVAQAQKRCSHLGSVEVSCASLAERMPVTGFDLLVLSEIGYYFSAEEWTRLASALTASMPQDGTLLATHWLGVSADHRMHGDEVHEILLSLPDLRLEHSVRHERFRLDRWVRA